jgi:hypothetical protein
MIVQAQWWWDNGFWSRSGRRVLYSGQTNWRQSSLTQPIAKTLWWHLKVTQLKWNRLYWMVERLSFSMHVLELSRCWDVIQTPNWCSQIVNHIFGMTEFLHCNNPTEQTESSSVILLHVVKYLTRRELPEYAFGGRCHLTWQLVDASMMVYSVKSWSEGQKTMFRVTDALTLWWLESKPMHFHIGCAIPNTIGDELYYGMKPIRRKQCCVLPEAWKSALHSL